MTRCRQDVWARGSTWHLLLPSGHQLMWGKHEQRSTYCGETGHRELHMPGTLIAQQHLHGNQNARHRSHFLVLKLRMGEDSKVNIYVP